MHLVATPTEYAGVVFRSKSEAQMALAIDMQEEFRHWMYEPKVLAVGKYIPDFLVRQELEEGFWIRVIECKPSPCTKTYMNKLSAKFYEIRKILLNGASPNMRMLTCEIWQGNTYNNDYKTWMHVGCSDNLPESIKQPFDDSVLSEWMPSECIKAASSYRFDLEANHA